MPRPCDQPRSKAAGSLTACSCNRAVQKGEGGRREEEQEEEKEEDKEEEEKEEAYMERTYTVPRAYPDTVCMDTYGRGMYHA